MSTTTPSSPYASGKGSDGSPVFRAIMGVVGRPFNAFVLKFAGSRYLRLYGVMQHRGRKSGRAYATPVIVRQTADGFVIPLAFGEGADWFQNLRAAGGGVVRWNGTTYQVADPVVIDWDTARPAFNRLERILVPPLKIQRFTRVRRAMSGEHAGEVQG